MFFYINKTFQDSGIENNVNIFRGLFFFLSIYFKAVAISIKAGFVSIEMIVFSHCS